MQASVSADTRNSPTGADKACCTCRGGCPERNIIAVTDSSYAAIDLLNAVRRRICMITRLRLDARLFDPPARRRPSAIGRPRVIGRRQPTLAARLADPKTRWERLKVTGWYGRGERLVDIVSATAIW